MAISTPTPVSQCRNATILRFIGTSTTEMVVMTTGAIIRVKLQSNRHRHPAFYAFTVAQPTVSEHRRENIIIILPEIINIGPGSFEL